MIKAQKIIFSFLILIGLSLLAIIMALYFDFNRCKKYTGKAGPVLTDMSTDCASINCIQVNTIHHKSNAFDGSWSEYRCGSRHEALILKKETHGNFTNYYDKNYREVNR